MANYYTGFICNNGHVRSSYGECSETFCPECGSEVIHQCPSCNTLIRGINNDEYSYLYKYKRPNYCFECSKPLPWTEKILENSVELLSLDTQLDSGTKALIKNALPDLLVETPTTNVAIAKYQTYMCGASKIVKDGMRNLLVDVLSETVKKSLFG